MRCRLAVFMMLVTSVFALRAMAQDYPNRPIRLVVPFAAGGGSDYVGRVVGQKLTEQMGQTVVVDNRPGAASLVGTELVAHAAPDGYTLCLCDVGFTINPAYYKKTNYDPIKDFDPIMIVAETPYILVVYPGLPYGGTLKAFIAAAKAQPGKLTLGSAGNGSGSHFSGELFKQRAGINLIHVPYKSAGASATDAATGQISGSMASTPAVLPLVKSGRLKILAAASAKRSALLPDVPTFAESGVPGVLMTNWYSVMSVGRTPKPVLKRLRDEITRATASPDMRDRLSAAALEPATSTPDQFPQLIADELQRWQRVVKESGIKPE